MTIELILAWRNIGRSLGRSGLIISALVLGIWAGTFAVALVKGLAQQRLQNQIDCSLGHLKITHPQFDEEKTIGYQIDKKELETHLKKTNIITYSFRLNTLAIIQAGQHSSSIDWYGVVPSFEKTTLKLADKLIEGHYLDHLPPKSLVIGKKLAQKLSVKLGDKINIVAQTEKNEPVRDTFQVGGIYDYHNHAFAMRHVFARVEDFRQTMQMTDNQHFHQLIIRLKNDEQALETAQKWQKALPQCKVQSWADIAPELAYLSILQGYFFLIFNGIILFTLTLLLVNTMLMAVLERTRELGVLKALGMNKRRLLRLIFYETLLLSGLGGGLGIGIAVLTVAYYGQTGIDLRYFGSAWGSWGSSPVVYPQLSMGDLWGIVLLLFLTALLSAIYPAYKVLQSTSVDMMKSTI
ncbi:MAG: FtsX-like permease family protein [Microscillaceae bacterium]|nr:FtsX-like permease family protein [Microscillaceae bacterium]